MGGGCQGGQCSPGLPTSKPQSGFLVSITKGLAHSRTARRIGRSPESSFSADGLRRDMERPHGLDNLATMSMYAMDIKHFSLSDICSSEHSSSEVRTRYDIRSAPP